MNKRMPESDITAIIPLLIGVWRRFHKEAGPPDKLQTREFRKVVADIEAFKAGFEKDPSLLAKNYFLNPSLLTSYILYYWVLHYQQGLSIFNELPSTPRRVLDVCSGPAALSLAALRHGANEVIAIDQNLLALELGADICGRYGHALSIRQWDYRKGAIPVTGQFDLIILGHCLGELFPTNNQNWKEKQEQFVLSLLDRLTPEGHLVIIDNSHLEQNSRILHLRDALVEKGVPIQAPCVWKGLCPALQTKDSPCYAQREFEKPTLIKEIQRAAKINLGSLKMTYIIFRNPKAGWPELPEKKLYRIISPPVETFQGKRYYLCGTDGKKNLGSHFKEQPAEARAFDYLRRGELISIDHALEKNNNLDIVQGTTVTLEAACGKPLPQTQEEYE